MLVENRNQFPSLLHSLNILSEAAGNIPSIRAKVSWSEGVGNKLDGMTPGSLHIPCVASHCFLIAVAGGGRWQGILQAGDVASISGVRYGVPGIRAAWPCSLASLQGLLLLH